MRHGLASVMWVRRLVTMLDDNTVTLDHLHADQYAMIEAYRQADADRVQRAAAFVELQKQLLAL
jgi:hypothetical protein